MQKNITCIVKNEKEHCQGWKRTQSRMKQNTVKNEKEHSQGWKNPQSKMKKNTVESWKKNCPNSIHVNVTGKQLQQLTTQPITYFLTWM